MRIEKALINLLGVSQPDVNSSTNPSSRNAFEAALNIVSDRNVNNNADTRGRGTESRRDNRDVDSRNSRQNNETSNKSARQETRDNNENISVDSKEGTDNIDKKSDYNLEDEYVLEEDNEELYSLILHANMMYYISNSLNIPKENVEICLKELNITPNELKDSSNVSRLVQIAYNVEEPVQLLEVPDINKVFSELSESINEAFLNTEKLHGLNQLVDDKTMLNFLENMVDDIAPQYKTQETKDVNASTELHNNKDIMKYEKQNSHLQGELYQGDKSQNNDSQSQGNENKGKEVLSTGPSNNPEGMNKLNTIIENAAYQSPNDLTNLKGNKHNMLADATIEGEVSFIGAGSKISSKAASLKAQPTANILAKDVIDQISDKIKVNIKGAVSEIKMLLKPESLGEVSLKIATENGIITAQFLAESQKIKEIIEANLNELRETLTQQGINISELSVSVGQDEAQGQMDNFLKEQEKSKQRISKILKNIAEDQQQVDAEKDSKNVVDPYDSSVNYTA